MCAQLRTRCLWTVEGSWSTQREPTCTCGENVISTQKGPKKYSFQENHNLVGY